ncbi:hypothetical protein AMTRI_Chr11g152530 [Amborella trichopoda]
MRLRQFGPYRVFEDGSNGNWVSNNHDPVAMGLGAFRERERDMINAGNHRSMAMEFNAILERDRDALNMGFIRSMAPEFNVFAEREGNTISGEGEGHIMHASELSRIGACSLGRGPDFGQVMIDNYSNVAVNYGEYEYLHQGNPLMAFTSNFAPNIGDRSIGESTVKEIGFSRGTLNEMSDGITHLQFDNLMDNVVQREHLDSSLNQGKKQDRRKKQAMVPTSSMCTGPITLERENPVEINGFNNAVSNPVQDEAPQETHVIEKEHKAQHPLAGPLLAAGWKIITRPGNGRAYGDSIYVSPSGAAYHSLPLALDTMNRELSKQKEREWVGSLCTMDGMTKKALMGYTPDLNVQCDSSSVGQAISGKKNYHAVREPVEPVVTMGDLSLPKIKRNKTQKANRKRERKEGDDEMILNDDGEKNPVCKVKRKRKSGEGTIDQNIALAVEQSEKVGLSRHTQETRKTIHYEGDGDKITGSRAILHILGLGEQVFTPNTCGTIQHGNKLPGVPGAFLSPAGEPRTTQSTSGEPKIPTNGTMDFIEFITGTPHIDVEKMTAKEMPNLVFQMQNSENWLSQQRSGKEVEKVRDKESSISMIKNQNLGNEFLQARKELSNEIVAMKCNSSHLVPEKGKKSESATIVAGFESKHGKVKAGKHSLTSATKKSASKSSSIQNSRKRNRGGGCELLVRRSMKGENQEDSLLEGKRNVLSWLIDTGYLIESESVFYKIKRSTGGTLRGRITREGIRCNCCRKVVSLSVFEVHAGSCLCQPWDNICLASGKTLMQCLREAWEEEKKSREAGLRVVELNGPDENDDTCGICADGGDLICCDNCPSTFHQECLMLKDLPEGSWYCRHCKCAFCMLPSDKADEKSVLLSCNQCGIKYHSKCLYGNTIQEMTDALTYCGNNCQKVAVCLSNIIGLRNPLEGGFYWTLLKRRDKDEGCVFNQRLSVLECNVKLAVALSVMDECFVPLVDPISGLDMISQVVYNCGSNFSRLNYEGFYTITLEKEDEIISVASLRLHGTKLAEMPFIGTRPMYRRRGMCRRLLIAIENMLSSLKVETLIIPAISDLLETWTEVFSFKPLESSHKNEMRKLNMMIFADTVLLQKSICMVTKEDMQEGSRHAANVGKLGNNIQEPKSLLNLSGSMDSNGALIGIGHPSSRAYNRFITEESGPKNTTLGPYKFINDHVVSKSPMEFFQEKASNSANCEVYSVQGFVCPQAMHHLDTTVDKRVVNIGLVDTSLSSENMLKLEDHSPLWTQSTKESRDTHVDVRHCGLPMENLLSIQS